MKRPKESLKRLRQRAREHFTDTSRRRGAWWRSKAPTARARPHSAAVQTWLMAQGSRGYDEVELLDLVQPVIRAEGAARISPEDSAAAQRRLPSPGRTRDPAGSLAGKVVIADRFLFTGLARDVARGLDLDWVLKLPTAALARPRFYFAVSPVTSSKRIAATRMPRFYRQASDVTSADDPSRATSDSSRAVIREYDSLALIFNFITVARSIQSATSITISADCSAKAAARVVRVECRRRRGMARHQQQRDITAGNRR